jgi:hypothetical protein
MGNYLSLGKSGNKARRAYREILASPQARTSGIR